MKTEDLKAAKANKQRLLDELAAAGAQIGKDGREIKCPFHDDRTPSSSVWQADDGWKFTCHACNFTGDVFDVIAKASNKTPSEVLKAETPRQNAPERRETAKPKTVYPTISKMREAINFQEHDKNGKVSNVFEYTNPKTQAVELAVFRIEYANGKKSFRQASPVEGGFVMSAPAGKMPLYNRTRITFSNAVIVVEGEKCVHALTKAGFLATTSAGGAGKAEKTDWTPLAGKDVYLWPDNDPVENGKSTGIQHMRDVQKILESIEPAPNLHWIDPETLDLPAKGDAADYCERYPKPDELKATLDAVLAFAEPMGGSEDLWREVESAIAGRRRAVPFPWSATSALTKANKPGSFTLLCGPAGSTKSFWLLQAVAWWMNEGIKVAIMELEEDKTYHLWRAWAQVVRNGKVTDEEWCQRNPDEARKLRDEARPVLDKLSKCIYTEPTGEVSPDRLIAWIEERCQAGCRIIAIDPITAMDCGKNQWVEDLRFVTRAKNLVSKYGASLILVTHPKKGAQFSGLDEMAGGAAYARFCRTALWFEAVDESQGQFVAPFGRQSLKYNRELIIRKARDSFGTNQTIGFYFDGKTLLSSECGAMASARDEERDSA